MSDAVSRREVLIPPHDLPGFLDLPEKPRGLVIFAHGSGSSRLSARNQAVAAALNSRGMASLLFDLLTAEEARDRNNVFDIPLLAQRLCEAVDWARSEPATSALRLGLFGASTGAGAALMCAATLGHDVAAVVSRGGRPDLAGAAPLTRVKSPVLLIVGGADSLVLKLNAQALELIRARKSLEVVPGATHLFEEAGAMETASALAGDWFDQAFAS